MDRSPLAGKKRKIPPKHTPQQASPKRSKRDNKPHAPSATTTHSSEFRQVEAELDIILPPMFIGNPRSGIQDMLDSMLMRYIPSLQGVVLAHSNLTLTSDTALILPGSPFARCTIMFKALVWSPRVGTKLKGRINLSSADHVSLLVHSTFNVSIPRQHLPFEEYEFEYGPAENDPEFGVRIADEASPSGPGVGEQEVRDPGRWVHRRTGVPLGGVERTIEFTIIGLTIANGMLSLLGSTLSDPFSPHLKPAPPQSLTRKARREKEVIEDGLQDEGDGPGVESNLRLEDDHPLAVLGKATDRLIESCNADAGVGPTVDSVRTQSDEKAAKAEKKRKRKDEKARTKEAAVKGSPVKKQKKEKAQS